MLINPWEYEYLISVLYNVDYLKADIMHQYLKLKKILKTTKIQFTNFFKNIFIVEIRHPSVFLVPTTQVPNFTFAKHNFIHWSLIFM